MKKTFEEFITESLIGQVPAKCCTCEKVECPKNPANKDNREKDMDEGHLVMTAEVTDNGTEFDAMGDPELLPSLIAAGLIRMSRDTETPLLKISSAIYKLAVNISKAATFIEEDKDNG
jgi:hypothetical protein